MDMLELYKRLGGSTLLENNTLNREKKVGKFIVLDLKKIVSE